MIRILGICAALVLAGAPVQSFAEDGGLVGGLLGAGAGAVLGGVVTGKAGGAAAGAVIGGATGAIIGNATEDNSYGGRNKGAYFTERGRCYYEYPDGGVVRVADHPC